MGTWQIILAAFGLVLIIEGAVYFALPDVSRKFLKMLLETKVQSLRRIGIVAVVVGLGLIWIASVL